MTLEIRELGPADHELWADCAQALFTGEPRETLLDEIRWHAGHGLGKSRAWVAERGHAVLGYAEISLRPYANGCRREPVVFLEAIWVTPEARARSTVSSCCRHICSRSRC